MGRPLLCVAIVSLMVAINVGALRAGDGRSTALHNLASLSGGLGILFILCVPISLIYAISNYLFGPAQDTSLFFKSALVAAGASTLISLVLCVSIRRQGVGEEG